MADYNQREMYRIKDGKILILGDLHLTNRNRGRHKNIEEESLYTIRKIEEIIDDINPATIILLGDIAGYDDTILEHSDFYAKFLNLFLKMRMQTKGRLFAVKGNHDFGVKTEWNILEQCCAMKNPKYIDFYKGNIRTTRMHFLNYGEEEQPIDLLVEKDITGRNKVTNIVFGHKDYYIDGGTTWFQTEDPTYVCDLHNLKGVSTIISGHIHAPLESTPKTTIDGEEVQLIYPGSMSRSASRDEHEYCYYLTLEHEEDENAVRLDFEVVELQPLNEILNPKLEKTPTTVEEIEETARQEAVQNIIHSLANRRGIRVDVMDQIDSKHFEIFSEASRKLAKETYQEAKNTVEGK